MVLVRDPGDLLELYEQFRLATVKTKGCCRAGQELLGDRRDAALYVLVERGRASPSIALRRHKQCEGSAASGARA